MPVHPNFHGVKGKSGRHSWDKEIEAKALWDLSVPVLKHALKSNEINIEKKIEIALALVNKMLPTTINGNGFKVSNIVYNINPKILSERDKLIIENANNRG